MKAIMIVDLPDNINVDLMCKTPVSLTFKHKSHIEILYASGYLKPMPQKKKLDEDLFLSKNFELEYVRFDGYNRCIDEILGKQE